jgi:archaellum component FlaC
MPDRQINYAKDMQMLNAKDISDRLLRLELAVSNITDQIVGMHKEVNKLMEDFKNAKRVTSTTAFDAGSGPRSETEEW